MKKEETVPQSGKEEYREVLNERITVTMRRGGAVTTVDALLLAALLPADCGRACELGAGSGVISLLAAGRGKLTYAELIERDATMAALAARNVRDNRLSDILTVRHTDIRNTEDSVCFNTVFTNPPYRRADEGRPAADPIADIARYERAGTIRDFCRVGARMLVPDGRFYAVFATHRRGELLSALDTFGLFPARLITVLPYPGGRSKIFLVEAATQKCTPVEECFTLCRGPGGIPTAEAEALYRDGILISGEDTL